MRYRKVVIDLTLLVETEQQLLEDLGYTVRYMDVVEVVADLMELFIGGCLTATSFGHYDNRAAELIVTRLVPPNPTDLWSVRRHRHRVVAAAYRFYSRSLTNTGFIVLDDYAIQYPKLWVSGHYIGA